MRIDFSANDPAQEHLETRRFRKLLEAFGYPARVFDLGEPARAALLACLCDSAVPVALEGSASALLPACRHRQVPLAKRAAAEFVFADAAEFSWQDLSLGTPEAPELAASVILEVGAFGMPDGAGTPFTLAANRPALTDTCRLTASGAGVKERAEFWLDRDSIAALAQRPAWPYPLGVDLILTAGQKLLALPRHLAWEIG